MASIEKRKNKDGSYSYRVSIRRKGESDKSATFQSLENAELWAKQIESAYEFKKIGIGYVDIFFKDVVDRYKKEHIPNLSSLESGKRSSQVDFWSEKLGDIYIKDITPEMIEKILSDLSKTITVRNKKPISPKTVHRRLAALSHVFTIAIIKWKYLEVNPCTLIERPDSKIIRTNNYYKAYSSNEIVLSVSESGEIKIKSIGYDVSKNISDKLKNLLK